LQMAIAVSRSTFSAMKKFLFILETSQWFFKGSPLMPSRAATSSVPKSVGTGPAMSSPSNRVVSIGQADSFTVGRLSLKE
jgi:hypothetical protein